jgi:hypothetical protein
MERSPDKEQPPIGTGTDVLRISTDLSIGIAPSIIVVDFASIACG